MKNSFKELIGHIQAFWAVVRSPKGTCTLKQCDWQKLHQMYCNLAIRHWTELDHGLIISAVLHMADQSGNHLGCAGGSPCLVFDYTLYKDDARALVAMIDLFQCDLADLDFDYSKGQDHVPEEIKDLLQDLRERFGMKQVKVATGFPFTTEVYELTNRLKSELQKVYL